MNVNVARDAEPVIPWKPRRFGNPDGGNRSGSAAVADIRRLEVRSRLGELIIEIEHRNAPC